MQKLNKWEGEGKGVFSGYVEETEKNHVAYQMEDGITMLTAPNITNSQLYCDTLLHSVAEINSIK